MFDVLCCRAEPLKLLPVLIHVKVFETSENFTKLRAFYVTTHFVLRCTLHAAARQA